MNRGERSFRLLCVTACLAVSGLAVRPTISGRADLVPWDALADYPPWRESFTSSAAKPHNALIADIVFQQMVWLRLNRAAWQRGERWRWNPHLLCGQPAYSGLLYGYRYPLDVFRRIVDPARAAAWMLAAHLALGATFCALLARRLGAGRPGALLAGFVYGFSAPVFFNMTFHTMQGALAWLPACLLAVQGLLDACRHPQELPRWRWAALAVLCHALSLLSGHPEIAAYTFVFSAGLAAWSILTRGQPGWRQTAGWAAGTLLASAAVAAWIAWPEREAFRNNFRAQALSSREVRSHGLPAYHLAGFLAPDFSGSPVQHRYFDPFARRLRAPERFAETGPVAWGDRNAVEGAVYFGVLPLALLGGCGWAQRQQRFFWAGLVWTGLLAFGTPLYALVYYGLPFARQLRTPVRWMIPAALCVAVLAGLGLERAETDPPARRRLRLLGGGCVLLAAGLTGAVGAALVFRAAAIRLVTPVFAGAWRVRQFFSGPPEFLAFSLSRALSAAVWIAAAGATALLLSRRKRPAGWAWLAPAFVAVDLTAHHAAFFTRAPDTPVRSPPPAVPFLQAQPGLFRIACFGEEKILPPNTAALFGLHDIRGYESVMDRRYIEFLAQIEPQTDLAFNQAGLLRQSQTLRSPWLDFLNVEFLLTDREISAEGWERCFDNGTLIYRNREALPRYYLALTRPRCMADGPPPRFEQGRVSVASYAAEKIRISVDTPEAAWLVSSETDLGFWKPFVNGLPADGDPLLGLFRCVRLPPGSHLVEWQLSPP